VTRAKLIPLPELTPDRLLVRMAEAMQVGMDPAKLREFPSWTQRVMRILKEQFIPSEFSSVLSAGQSIFADGIAVALATKAQDLAQSTGTNGGDFARVLAEMLTLDAHAKEVAVQVGSGSFISSDKLQRHVMNRLFESDFLERRAFIEGMAVGNRLPELFDSQVKRNATDATEIYLMLWLNSVGEVARILEPLFAKNRNKAGVHWEERIRKLSNRIGLSFRAKQNRRRKIARG
jgi:hypothetical protein